MPEHDDIPTFLHDQLMDDVEMADNWDRISKMLHVRVMKARAAHMADPDNSRKSRTYLVRAKEYYAFSRLVYLFGKMLQVTMDEQLPPVVPKPKGGFN